MKNMFALNSPGFNQAADALREGQEGTIVANEDVEETEEEEEGRRLKQQVTQWVRMRSPIWKKSVPLSMIPSGWSASLEAAAPLCVCGTVRFCISPEHSLSVRSAGGGGFCGF